MSGLQSSSPQTDATLSFRETRRRLGEDRRRLEDLHRRRGIPLRGVALSPSFVCVALYRLSRYLHARGWRLAARLIWHLNLVLTGADMSPISDIGAGLVVVHPVAVTVVGCAGRDLTIEGLGGLGGGLDLTDIGAGPGLPRLGDDVQLAFGAMVLGPVNVGSGVRIGAGCTIVRDLPDGCEVLAHPIRVLRGEAAAERSDHVDEY